MLRFFSLFLCALYEVQFVLNYIQNDFNNIGKEQSIQRLYGNGNFS